VRGAESEKDSASILFINAKEKWIYQKSWIWRLENYQELTIVFPPCKMLFWTS